MPWAASVGLLTLLTGIGFDLPAVTLLAVVLSTTAVLGRRLDTDVALPVAVAGLLLVSAALGVAAELAGTDLLAAPAVVRFAQLAWAVLCVAVCSRPRQGAAPPPTGGRRHRVALVSAAPACVAAAVGVAQVSWGGLARAWAAVGTDVANHLVVLQGVHDAGAFDYGSTGYPRSLHLLLALVDPVARDVHGPELLDRQLTTFAATTWFTTALLLWTAAAVVRRVALALGAGQRAAALAAAAVGATLLASNSFVLAFVMMGAAPALLAVVVLWTPVLWALSSQHRLPLHLVVGWLAVGTALVSHLWQALASAGVLAAVALLVTARGHLLRALAGSVRAAALSTAVLLASVAVAAPALLGIVRTDGLEAAGIPGEIAPVPTPALLVAVVAVVAAWRCRGHLWVTLTVGTTAGTAVTVGVLLLASGSLDITQWYPMKALWMLTLFLTPFGGGVLAWCAVPATRNLWTRLGRLELRVRLARFTVLAVSTAAVFSFVLPVALLYRPVAALAVVEPPAWARQTPAAGAPAGESSADGWEIPRYRSADVSRRRVEVAERHATAHAPAVAVPVAVGFDPVFDARASSVVSALMSVQTGQPYTTGDPRRVCDDVRVAAGDRDAVVVTGLPVRELRRVMDDRGCGDVPVVRVPGGSTSVPFQLDP